jgi:hypothetical protein
VVNDSNVYEYVQDDDLEKHFQGKYDEEKDALKNLHTQGGFISYFVASIIKKLCLPTLPSNGFKT